MTRRQASRRCCGDASAAPGVGCALAEGRRPRLRRTDLDRARLRPQRRADPPGQPRLRGARRRAAAGLAGRPAGDRHRRGRRPEGRCGRRLVRRWARAAARRAGQPGRRDRSDDHLERPVPGVPAGEQGKYPTQGYSSPRAGLFSAAAQRGTGPPASPSPRSQPRGTSSRPARRHRPGPGTVLDRPGGRPTRRADGSRADIAPRTCARRPAARPGAGPARHPPGGGSTGHRPTLLVQAMRTSSPPGRTRTRAGITPTDATCAGRLVHGADGGAGPQNDRQGEVLTVRARPYSSDGDARARLHLSRSPGSTPSTGVWSPPLRTRLSGTTGTAAGGCPSQVHRASPTAASTCRALLGALRRGTLLLLAARRRHTGQQPV